MKLSDKSAYLNHFEEQLKQVKDRIGLIESRITDSNKNIKTAEFELHKYRRNLEGYKRIENQLSLLISDEIDQINYENRVDEEPTGHTEEQTEVKAESHFKSLRQIQDEDEK